MTQGSHGAPRRTTGRRHRGRIPASELAMPSQRVRTGRPSPYRHQPSRAATIHDMGGWDDMQISSATTSGDAPRDASRRPVASSGNKVQTDTEHEAQAMP